MVVVSTGCAIAVDHAFNWLYSPHKKKVYTWIKSVIDRPTSRTNNRLPCIRNHFERPLRWTLADVLRVCLIWLSLDFLLYLAKPSTTIDYSASVQNSHLELNLWRWPRTLTSKQVARQHNLSPFDLDLWLWPTIPPLTRSRSTLMPKIKVIGQTVQLQALTDRQTDGLTLPNVLSPLLCGR